MARRTEITTPEVLPDEGGHERSLRPRQLSEFIGQGRLKENLRIAIEAATARRDPLDHILFHGPPGLGKTTLAMLLAREMGVGFTTTSGPVLEKPADLVGALHQPAAGRHPLHRRDPPSAPRDRGVPLPGHGGLSRRGAPLGRPPRPDHDDGGRALHPGGRHDPLRPAHRPHAGPLRDHRTARFLPGARPCGDHRAECRTAGRRGHDGGGARAGGPGARDRPGWRTGCCGRVRDFAEVRAEGVLEVEVVRDALDPA